MTDKRKEINMQIKDIKESYENKGLLALFSKAIIELELDLAQEVSRELEIRVANKIDDLMTATFIR